jgi:hypothetical protein
MTITVFRDIDKLHDLSSMFLDINAQPYKIYYSCNNELEQYDISIDPPPPGNYASVKFKVHLQLDIWDNFENQSWANANNSQREMYVISNAWDQNYISNNVIYNDFLFNRTKAYYQGYTFSQSTKLWYWHGQDAYQIPSQKTLKNKIYIAPNKTWNADHRKNYFRPRIVDALLEKYANIGYIGDYHRNPKLFLYPQWGYSEYGAEILKLESFKIPISAIKSQNLIGYSPPHNAYYEDTFISIYGETIEYGTTIAPTEKTYDPLIKGHFILPFSCSGFIQFLRTKGFQFPEFIDYSYDEITNDEKRFECYLKEVDRLLAMPLIDWQQHWANTTEIRQYNQTIFKNTPYDRVDLYKYL